MSNDSNNLTAEKPLNHWVERCLNNYFHNLDGEQPQAIYQMVMEQVEPALLKASLRHACGNQSLAAKILGISRVTLRKKLADYGLM